MENALVAPSRRPFSAQEAPIRKLRVGVVAAIAAVTLLAVFRIRAETPRIYRDPDPAVPPAAPPVDLDALRSAGM